MARGIRKKGIGNNVTACKVWYKVQKVLAVAWPMTVVCLFAHLLPIHLQQVECRKDQMIGMDQSSALDGFPTHFARGTIGLWFARL